MNAIVTQRPAAALIAAPRAQVAARPAAEWWTVGHDRFESTAALLQKNLPPGTSATYHWQSDSRPAALAANTAQNTRSAALGGGIVGALAGSAIVLAAGLSGGTLLAAVGLTLAAGLSTALTARQLSDDYAKNGATVAGTLDGNSFTTANEQHVDLNAHARGESPEAWWTAPVLPYPTTPWG